MSRSVTIMDVARAAAVSRATVSKVLNDQPRVAPGTRAHVRATIEQLGYRPNAAARGLRRKCTRTIAIITDDLEGLFTASMMRGLEEVVAERDYGVLLCNSYGDHERERRHLQRLTDQRIEGLVLMAGNRVQPRGGPAYPMPGVPIVYLYQYNVDGQSPSILPDDRGGATLAVEHLFDTGRRRIAFVNGPSRFEATKHRRLGVEDAFRAAGSSIHPELILTADDWYPEHGYNCAAQLLERRDPPDAIFCASDDLAAGALARLQEEGIRIGPDIALIGFDDRPLAAHLHPPLSTIRLPLAEMGRRAGELLLSTMDGADRGHVTERIACELVIRASTRTTNEKVTRSAW